MKNENNSLNSLLEKKIKKPFLNKLGLAQIIVLILTIAIGLISYLYIQKIDVDPSDALLFIFSLIYGLLGYYILLGIVGIFELIATIIQIAFTVKYVKYKKSQTQNNTTKLE